MLAFTRRRKRGWLVAGGALCAASILVKPLALGLVVVIVWWLVAARLVDAGALEGIEREVRAAVERGEMPHASLELHQKGACPTCGGKMWDNRADKAAGRRNGKAPAGFGAVPKWHGVFLSW